MAFGKLVGDTGAVHAFEPQRLTFQLLCANAALNGLTNIRSHQQAVGDAPGEVRVPLPDLRRGGNIGAFSLENAQDGETVPVVTLDSMGLRSVKLIKIDVEGMEATVLSGARKLIAMTQPVIFVENNIPAKSRDLIQLLFDLGYRCWWHLASYYNPNNFYANPHNIFAVVDRPEINLLCLPRTVRRLRQLCATPDDTRQAALARSTATSGPQARHTGGEILRINLVTVCGQRATTTLKHMLDHYSAWVSDVFIVVHRIGERDPIEDEVRAVVDEVGCGIHKSVVADHFDPVFATKLYSEVMNERPDDWWIIADPDELHLYFDEIHDIIQECEARGCSFVGGHFLDRFGPDGSLPKIDDSNIWRQFPVAGMSRTLVTGDSSWKICLAKGGAVRLGPGQHFVFPQDGVVGYPMERGLVQVHHFKWDSTVLARQLDTLATLKSAAVDIDRICHARYRAMYDHLVANGNKADVTNPKGLFAYCPEADFSAYPHWPNVVRDVIEHSPAAGFILDWPL